MAGPEQVLAYLARYTHRVAIANSRLVAFEDGRVSFRYKDYAQGGRQRVMSLDGVEFVRRFLLHVLPRGFVRIRHYGLLANACRREKIARCRVLIDTPANTANGDSDSAQDDSERPCVRCPECSLGVMITIEVFRPYAPELSTSLPSLDSS
jgi:hypothetical protein